MREAEESGATKTKRGTFRFPSLHLAEREGFEPSIELLTLYSLSRGAPSASRASLRMGLFAEPDGPVERGAEE
jgi:hypothetical protein